MHDDDFDINDEIDGPPVRYDFTFVEEELWDAVVRRITPAGPGIGKNAPCPCGSKKKFKACSHARHRNGSVVGTKGT